MVDVMVGEKNDFGPFVPDSSSGEGVEDTAPAVDQKRLRALNEEATLCSTAAGKRRASTEERQPHTLSSRGRPIGISGTIPHLSVCPGTGIQAHIVPASPGCCVVGIGNLTRYLARIVTAHGQTCQEGQGNIRQKPPSDMASVSADATDSSTREDLALVDPRAPRFGQTLTTLGLLAGIVLLEPLLVIAVAVVLNTAFLSGWRIDLYAFLWRNLMIPLLGPPEEREPASPHRFARFMGAVFTAFATVLLLVDMALTQGTAVAFGLSAPALAAFVIAGLVAALAALAASTGICIGCRMYRQVSFFRKLGVV